MKKDERDSYRGSVSTDRRYRVCEKERFEIAECFCQFENTAPEEIRPALTGFAFARVRFSSPLYRLLYGLRCELVSANALQCAFFLLLLQRCGRFSRSFPVWPMSLLLDF
ncbi:MAG: hypothetical protein DMF04_02235 [Verrucomicrobia bacterium]|nr:MAG: hypothetical protein DMF04_02235 [Verrucomicrobiota bacterium]